MFLIILLVSFVGVACLVGGVASLILPGEKESHMEDRLRAFAGTAQVSSKGRGDKGVLAQSLEDSGNPLEEFVLRFFDLKTFLQQADAPITAANFVMLSVGLASVGLIIIPLCRAPLIFAPLGLVLGVIPFTYFYFKRKKRLAAFAKQLPEALELISRALRAGHSLASGFKLVCDEMPAPIGTEFGRCFEAQNLGQPLELAIDEMTDRVPNLDLRFFATAVILQRQTGGDLAEILDKIGHLVRERFKIWGQIQALTGEGRLSGIVLLAMPPVLAAAMAYLNPGYMKQLITDPLGHKMLAGGILMQIIGAFVIRKIVNIKV